MTNSTSRPISRVWITMTAIAVIVILALPANAQTSDLTGRWDSSIGLVYDITQTGQAISWKVTTTPQTATGAVQGDSVNASWTGPRSTGSATGKIIRDQHGRAVRIEWSNGVVFNRELAHSVHPATPQGGQPVPGPGQLKERTWSGTTTSSSGLHPSEITKRIGVGNRGSNSVRSGGTQQAAHPRRP